MFCTKCGTQLPESVKFCSSCGKPTEFGYGSGAAEMPRVVPVKRLRRIKSQKKIAGVCAGFADYFDTDITLMRIIWVALLLLPPNIGLIGYIVAWAVLPTEVPERQS